MEVQRADAVCSLVLLQGRGIPVECVIDVGAAEGSFFLIRHEAGLFPRARHFFVDAMDENRPLYERIAAAFPAEHAIAAAANFDGETDLQVDPGAYNTHVRGLQPEAPRYASRRVAVRTLDGLCAERGLGGPYLVKVDVQGGELDVLRGACKVLEGASIVVLEAQICLFRDTLPDLMEFMRTRDFVLYDLTNLSYYQSDHTLYQCLAVFIARRFDFRRQEPYPSASAEATERERLAARQKYIRDRIEQTCAVRAGPVHATLPDGAGFSLR